MIGRVRIGAIDPPDQLTTRFTSLGKLALNGKVGAMRSALPACCNIQFLTTCSKGDEVRAVVRGQRAVSCHMDIFHHGTLGLGGVMRSLHFSALDTESGQLPLNVMNGVMKYVCSSHSYARIVMQLLQ